MSLNLWISSLLQHKPSQAEKLSRQLQPVSLKHRLVKAKSLHDEIQQLEHRQRLSGRWTKDNQASTSMEEAIELVALPWVLKKALILLNTLEIDATEEHFQTNIKAGGVMDVVERYPWNGQIVEHSRRDKRWGKHRGRVYTTDNGDPVIAVDWDAPYGGTATDTFLLDGDNGDTLVQESYMKMKETGKEASYKTVYKRVHH